jgi:heterogeneous nuclear rnp K-like protein 2
MAEADYNRKRSRSPSDSDEKKHHKRPNTGATAHSDDSRADKHQGSGSATATSMTHDVNMTEPPASVADTTASTPSPKGTSSDHRRDESRTRSDEAGKPSSTTSAPPSSSSGPAPPSASIHMRCLIVTQDASIIIGKGGSHVNEIRDKSGARVMVSESIPGNPERILNVSGPLDAVSKVSCRRHCHTLSLFITRCTGFWSHCTTYQ